MELLSIDRLMSLSKEVHDLIWDLLGKEDLCNLRLASQALHTCSSNTFYRKYWPTLKCDLSLESLKDLRKLSKHRYFKQNVRRLRFVMERRERKVEQSRQETRRELLKNALRSLCNIKEVIYEFHDDDLYKNSPVQLPRVPVDDVSRIVFYVLDSLDAAELTGLDSLKMHLDTLKEGIDPRAFDMSKRPTRGKVLSSLRVLELNVRRSQSPDQDAEIIHRFLQPAAGLRSLKLRSSGVSAKPLRFCDREVFHWRQLESLTLDGLAVKAPNFSELLVTTNQR